MMLLHVSLACAAIPAAAFVIPAPIHVPVSQRSTTSMALQSSSTSRADFLTYSAAILGTTVASIAAAPALAVEEMTTESGLKIRKLQKGSGQTVLIGDLVAIRFKASFQGRTFDDIFDTPEPLYCRAGGNNLVKGLEEAIMMMRVGDRWEVAVPGKLAFGEKGRPPSAGKPRIPPMAELVYEVEVVGLPGKEEDIIEMALDEAA